MLSLTVRGFPGGPVVKNPPCDAGNKDSIPVQETDPSFLAATIEPTRHN